MWLEDMFKGGAEGIIEGAGKAIQIAASAFKADPTKVAEFDLEIKRITAEAINKASEHEAAMFKAAADDRNSARQREMAVKDWTPSMLAWLVLGFWGLGNYFVFTHALPAGSETLIARVLGTIDMAVGLVLGYYFGSSAGSSSKQNLIEKLSDRAAK